MTVNTLRFIADSFKNADIPYCYRCWTKPLTFPYFVGEYHDFEPFSESGESESVMIIDGFTDSDYLSLENIKEQIRDIFPPMGKTQVYEDGSGAAVMFVSAKNIPCGSDGIKRIQITLKIKEWRD